MFELHHFIRQHPVNLPAAFICTLSPLYVKLLWLLVCISLYPGHYVPVLKQALTLRADAFFCPCNEKTDRLVSGLVPLLKDDGFVALVEGVENMDQHEYSVNVGFDYIHGFQWAKPMPIDEL